MASDYSYFALSLHTRLLKQRVESMLKQREFNVAAIRQASILGYFHCGLGCGEIEEDRGLLDGELTVRQGLDPVQPAGDHVASTIPNGSAEHIEPVRRLAVQIE